MVSSKDIVLIDADVILRYLIGDNDGLYSEAKEVFDEILEGKRKGFIPTLVVAELVHVLQHLYGLNRKIIAGTVLEILKLRNILTDNKQLLLKALEIYDQSDLNFNECILCAYSQYYTLITFDENLRKCLDKREEKGKG